MATRQGFTAQITQSADDARRTIINSAPQSLLSHRWFSNMNTTCTIKSAPPRTPEVMTLLSTKSGWLVKRNEQGIWQRRYCCVVPHTFLYYFDSGPSSGGAVSPPGGGSPVGLGHEGAPYGADAGGFAGSGGGMNSSRHGHANAAGGAGRGAGNSFSTSNHSYYATGVGEKTDSGERRDDPDAYGGGGSSAGPVGIIDLECYSQINRQTIDDRGNGMELTGDSITNPDLRSFFFQGEHPEDCERWTTAMLSDRHQALRDEREAYRQVCESFPIQLAEMSKLIDEAEQKAKEREVESYQVRSSAEEGRKVIIDLVRECIEKITSHATNGSSMTANSPFPGTPSRRRNSSSSMSGASAASAASAASNQNGPASIAFKKKLREYQVSFLSELDVVLNQSHHRIMGGAPESVSLLVNLLERVVNEYQGAHSKLEKMEGELQKKQYMNRSEFVDLEDRLRKQAAKFSQKEQTHSSRIAELEGAIQQLQSEKKDLEQMLNTSQMEASIYANNTKTKMKELVEHRRILKKEVIDLRNTVENTKSEVDVLTHQQVVLTQKYKDEKRRRTGLSENYTLLRDQLNVQERVWGMMQSSLSSVAGGMGEGGGGASVAAGSLPPEIMMGFPGGASPAAADVYGKRSHFHPRDVVVKKRGGSVGANSGNERRALDLDEDGKSEGTPSSVDSRRSGGVSLADSTTDDEQENDSTSSEGGRGEDMEDTDSRRQRGASSGVGLGAGGMGGGGKMEQRSSGVVPPLHPNRQRSVGGHRRDASNDDLSCDMMSEITMPLMMGAAVASVRDNANQGFEEGEGPDDASRTEGEVDGDVNGEDEGLVARDSDNTSNEERKEATALADVTASTDSFDAPIIIEDDLQHRRASVRGEHTRSAVSDVACDSDSANKETEERDTNDSKDSPTRRRMMREMRELKAMGKVSNSKVKAGQNAASQKSTSDKVAVAQEGEATTDTWSSPAEGVLFMKSNATLKTIPSAPTASSSSEEDLAALATSNHSSKGRIVVEEGQCSEGKEEWKESDAERVENKLDATRNGAMESNVSATKGRETPKAMLSGGGMCGIVLGTEEGDGTGGGGLTVMVECSQNPVQNIVCENEAFHSEKDNILEEEKDENYMIGDGDNSSVANKKSTRKELSGDGNSNTNDSLERTTTNANSAASSTMTSGHSQKATKRSSKRIPSSPSVKSTKSTRSGKTRRGSSKGNNGQKVDHPPNDTENSLPPPPPPPPLMPLSGRREEKKRPPSYGGGYAGSDTQNRQDISPSADASSVVSNRSMKSDALSTLSSQSAPVKRMSMAERARLDADSLSQSVKVSSSPESTPPRPLITKGSAAGTPRNGLGPQARSPSTGSFFSLLGTRLNDAIDNSVLGVKVPSDGSSQSQDGQPAQGNRPRDAGTPRMNALKLPQLGGGRNSRNSTPVKQRPEGEIEAKTPLQVRQQQQREKQLAFLKERGLLK